VEAKELFGRCLSQANHVIAHVSTDNFSLLTPDTEWDVHALSNHMLYELSWIPDILSGKTVEEVGNRHDGNIIDSDPIGTWQKAGERAIQAIEGADLTATAHLSYGDTSNEDYIREVSGDLLIHSWDLAAGLGLDRHLDSEAVAVVYERLLPQKAALHDSGLFATPLEVPDGADIQTKLLALTGRDAGWQSPK
jgi:uncharacterized protein (TIGR03086 family)